MISKTSQQADADIFTAIAHPMRRQILDQLIRGEESVTELAEPFGVSRSAISQHLRVLRDTGLVTEQRHGRERRYRLHPEGLYEIHTWMQKYDHFWDQRLKSLDTYLEQHQ